MLMELFNSLGFVYGWDSTSSAETSTICGFLGKCALGFSRVSPRESAVDSQPIFKLTGVTAVLSIE